MMLAVQKIRATVRVHMSIPPVVGGAEVHRAGSLWEAAVAGWARVSVARLSTGLDPFRLLMRRFGVRVPDEALPGSPWIARAPVVFVSVGVVPERGRWGPDWGPKNAG